MRGGQPSNWSQFNRPTFALPPSFSVMYFTAAAPLLSPRSAFFVTRKPDGIVGSLTQVLKQKIVIPASFAFFNAAIDPSAEIGVITIALTPRVM